MKKIALILTTTLILLSCSIPLGPQQKPDDIPQPSVKTSEGELKKTPGEYQYREYSLEGCQYIVVGFGKDRWGTHKGNCSNPIHSK